MLLVLRPWRALLAMPKVVQAALTCAPAAGAVAVAHARGRRRRACEQDAAHCVRDGGGARLRGVHPIAVDERAAIARDGRAARPRAIVQAPGPHAALRARVGRMGATRPSGRGE